jgi:hypothetical protein
MMAAGSRKAPAWRLVGWNTLIYVIVYTPGVGLIGFDWFWVILALLLDISHWTASYTQRNQIPGVR